MFNILILRHLMQSFLLRYVKSSTVHILINNLVVILSKSSKYLGFYRDFNVTLNFRVFSTWVIFTWVLFLNILLLRQSSQFYLSMDVYCTHSNEHFGGCIIKIKQILSILQGF